MLKKSKNNTKKRVGRPPLPQGEKIVYQRIAVYPKTYKRIKQNSQNESKTIATYLEEVIQ